MASALMGNARLELLGTCRLVLPDGQVEPAEGARRQTAIAIAALSPPGLTDAQMGTLLSDGRGGRRTSEIAVRTLRNRLPGEIKKLLGGGAHRWAFPRVAVDVREAKAAARDLLREGIEADGDALKRVLDRLGRLLLPDIGPESAGETAWLIERRGELQGLRRELVVGAISWAGHRSDPWEMDLRELARQLGAKVEEPNSRTRSQGRGTVSGPTISNLWSPNGPMPIGRGRELRKLQEGFANGTRRWVIWGDAGIGKSVLANAYAESVDGYRLRWRIDSDTDVKLREGLRRLGRKLEIPSAVGSAFSVGADQTERFLGDLGDCLSSDQSGRWLLLLDNVERPASLEPVWASLPENGHVIVTSQWRDWEGTGLPGERLWNLDLDHATELLARESRRLADDNADMRKICQDLDCHPMLLRHAGQTMYSDGIGPTEYLEKLSGGIERAVRLWPELDGTRRHAITTYRLAIERATAAAPGAGPLIEVVSFMGPEMVTEAILRSGIVRCAPELADSDDVTRARRELRNRSLIEDYQRTESFTVPAVTQAVVRITLDEEKAVSRLSAAVEALKKSLPAPGAANAYEQRMWLAPHIDAVLGHVEERGDSRLRTQAAELASQLGEFRRSQAEWEAAEAAHKRAVDFSRDDEDRRAAGMRAVRLANVIRRRERFGDAEMVMAATLPALREATDADDPELSHALTVQGRILRRKPGGSPAEAYRFLEEALQILDRRGEDVDREQLSRTLNYSAVLLRQLGRYEEAEERSRRGFELLTSMEPQEWLSRGPGEKVPSHRLADHLRSLGNLWRLLGWFPASLDAHLRALEIVETRYGDDHTDIGVCFDSIGRTQRERGEFDDALSSFERAQEIATIRFGEESTPAATALANIALTLGEMDREPEAFAAAEKAVEICRNNFGDNWADVVDRGRESVGELWAEKTAWTVFVRARFRALHGEQDAAVRDHREVLRLRKKLYGSAHPHVAASLQGLADVHSLADDRREEAVDLNRDAREIRVEVFGGDGNFWVAQSDARLGELVEDPQERRDRLEAAERVWIELLVPDHPWLLRLRRALAELD